MRINGTKGKLPKQQLKKSGTSVRKKKRFRFTKGSTNVFKLTGKDVGELKSIVVEVSADFLVWSDEFFVSLKK